MMIVMPDGENEPVQPERKLPKAHVHMGDMGTSDAARAAMDMNADWLRHTKGGEQSRLEELAIHAELKKKYQREGTRSD